MWSFINEDNSTIRPKRLAENPLNPDLISFAEVSAVSLLDVASSLRNLVYNVYNDTLSVQCEGDSAFATARTPKYQIELFGLEKQCDARHELFNINI